ncbi:hypothetical protein CDD82_3332 [Ophiocordyceps australis]|uniref:Uncharacterized protein n=1 Tax=Ophiocordyceps australis TaxID=1399860 RepID=A0A2C5ZQ01_9HYPO|nr:hypothetical protein CDD82_3332 [Ophiocordyceps australis]
MAPWFPSEPFTPADAVNVRLDADERRAAASVARLGPRVLRTGDIRLLERVEGLIEESHPSDYQDVPGTGIVPWGRLPTGGHQLAALIDGAIPIVISDQAEQDLAEVKVDPREQKPWVALVGVTPDLIDTLGRFQQFRRKLREKEEAAILRQEASRARELEYQERISRYRDDADQDTVFDPHEDSHDEHSLRSEQDAALCQEDEDEEYYESLRRAQDAAFLAEEEDFQRSQEESVCDKQPDNLAEEDFQRFQEDSVCDKQPDNLAEEDFQRFQEDSVCDKKPDNLAEEDFQRFQEDSVYDEQPDNLAEEEDFQRSQEDSVYDEQPDNLAEEEDFQRSQEDSVYNKQPGNHVYHPQPLRPGQEATLHGEQESLVDLSDDQLETPVEAPLPLRLGRDVHLGQARTNSQVFELHTLRLGPGVDLDDVTRSYNIDLNDFDATYRHLERDIKHLLDVDCTESTTASELDHDLNADQIQTHGVPTLKRHADSSDIDLIPHRKSLHTYPQPDSEALFDINHYLSDSRGLT